MCAGWDCDRPLMDVKHFDGIVHCEHICRIIDGGQSSTFKLHTEGPGEVLIKKLTWVEFTEKEMGNSFCFGNSSLYSIALTYLLTTEMLH